METTSKAHIAKKTKAHIREKSFHFQQLARGLYTMDRAELMQIVYMAYDEGRASVK